MGGDRGLSSGGREPRAEREPRREGPPDPHIPDSVQAGDLDRVTLNSLRTLPEGLAEIVARHLVAAGQVLSDDPQLALAHAKAASRRAGRVAVVREAVGVAAYAAGDYGTALTELKAAARISGAADYLPMIADCERGLGRPERALALASSPEAGALDRDGKVEMLIVAAGARRDLGQPEAAVLTLQVPALKSRARGEWLARLRYAYADALAEVGRVAEAREWFARAADVDPEGTTDAAERLDELDGIVFDDVDADDGDEVGSRAAEPGPAGAERDSTRGSRSGDAASGDGRSAEGRSGDLGAGVAGPGVAGPGVSASSTVSAPATGSDLFRAPTSPVETAVVPEDQE